jgi:hypothetical protein
MFNVMKFKRKFENVWVFKTGIKEVKNKFKKNKGKFLNF